MNILSLSPSPSGTACRWRQVALIGRSLGRKRPQLAASTGESAQRIGSIDLWRSRSFLFLLCGRFLYQIYFDEPHVWTWA